MRVALIWLLCCSVAISDDFVITDGPDPTPSVVVQPVYEYDYFVLFKTRNCSPCVQMEKYTVPALKAAGYRVKILDFTEHPEWNVTSGPEIWLAHNSKRRRAWRGFVAADELLQATVVKPVVVKSAPVVILPQPAMRLPVVDTQWGRIDLETYNRNCNCSMCVGIRALQQQYRQQATILAPPTSAVSPVQEPTPDDTIDDMLALMRLTSDDVLCDLGCGDARILIAAVELYGCTGIGVEIDPKAADVARQRVVEAGLATEIRIITGDALDFDPKKYNVTAMTAYLYPELLAKLADKFKSVRVGASPYHEIPGLGMTQHGNVWIYRSYEVDDIVDTVTVGSDWVVPLKTSPQRFQFVP